MLGVAAWFGALSAWNAARIWTPYDQRVSFSGGRLVSHEFEVNAEGWYGIYVFSWEGYYDRSSNALHWPEWKWEVLEGGRSVAQGKGVTPWDTAHFRAHKGRYSLVLAPDHVVTGPARVLIEECGGLREDTQFWLGVSGDLLVLLVTINLGVFVRSIVVRRLDARDIAARATSLTRPGSMGPAPRVDSAIRHPWDLNARHRPDFTRLSWHAYLLFIVVFVTDVALGVMLTLRFPVKGLTIRLLRPGIQGTSVPQLEPLVVRVEKGLNGGPLPPWDWQSMSEEQVRLYRARSDDHILYFNSQRISWDQLGPLLDKELMRRPSEWPVYVRGDGDLEWRSVLRAIDIIRGKEAQVALLTDWGKPK